MTQPSLRSRKQQFVTDAIFDAAIELFAAKSFDETTVEEVARAAGVSRATFFRYFSSKDDLLGQNVLKYGNALTTAIKTSPLSLSPFEIMKETVLSVARRTVNHPRLRKVIEISQRSGTAMQAHNSRLIKVEESVAEAYAERIENEGTGQLDSRLLAALTLSVMNLAIGSWYRGESQEITAAVEQVFSRLTNVVSRAPNPYQSAINRPRRAKHKEADRT